jgi:hypothetical protein
MQVKLFGHRCLVEHYKSKSASKVIIPDAAQQRDSHRLGVVRFIGDGLGKPAYDPATLQRSDTPAPSLVKPGDVVMFQINQIMEATQKFVCEGRTYMNILQGDLLARVNGEELTVDNLEMLGDYVLLKHFVRRPEGSSLFLPDDVIKQSAPDFIYFKCIQKGSTVGEHFSVGDELICNLGRLTPMFIVHRKPDGTSENEEYCYTHKSWVDGVVSEVEGAVVAQ